MDEIAATEGIDVLWLGHFDLTNFLGIPAQFDHPRYLDALEKMAAAARRYNKVLACMSANNAWSTIYWDRGFRMFAMGVDSMLLQNALQDGIQHLSGLSK